MAIGSFSSTGNGLAIGDARRLGIEFELVLLHHLRQLGAQVHVAKATDHRFVGGRVTLDLEGRVLHGQFAEDIEQTLLVALLLRLDGQAGHRLREFERLQVNMVFVVRVVQHAVEGYFVDLGHSADFARQQFIHLEGLGALDTVKVCHLERFLAVTDEELHFLLHRALMHAEDADLAHVGVDDHLEHMRQHMAGGVRFGGERLHRTSELTTPERRRVALSRIRREFRQHLQQLGNACTGLGRHEQDGNQMPFAQRLLERCMQLVGAGIGTLLQITCQQLLVLLDDLVDQRAVRRSHRLEIGIA